MTKVTLAMALEPAALDIAQELTRRGADGQPPLDLIAQALVYWVEAEAAQLLAHVTEYLNHDTAQAERLVRALHYAANFTNSRPPLQDLRERRKAARILAKRHHLAVEPWMLWAVWENQIGCNLCQVLGPVAPCWGQRACHGYENGCGCQHCNTRARIHQLSREEQEP